MKRVNFTYEMAEKIAEIVDLQFCSPEFDGYEGDEPENVRRRNKHVETLVRLDLWALQEMSKRLAKGYEPKEEQ